VASLLFLCLFGYSYFGDGGTDRREILHDGTYQSFRHSFFALPIIRFTKSARNSAVQMCQVATVVMEVSK